ncbi:DUF2911 domain-containing protein [Ferruginibacter paludis]|uniref:DUF2911 domain-containing protein n=1 Tax=Ferruginibacter paludis TaxID=1310417 RepID=UPI0025B5EAF4|nr:DUF2911 domain-containing protein [Ferruginibacter paludis]MDN3655108.1 DUF2911 domain-containing protein [Ferruginibacter paludis]
MKKNLTAFACAGILFISVVSAQVSLPSPSTTQTVKQEFGMGSIELVYSRPNIKNRTVFGDLVPYGKLWRTGANGATRLTFTTPVEIGSKKIDTGSYALYTIPSEESWEIILNKGISNGGTSGYKESEDVVHFTVPAVKTIARTETFTIQFANIKPESCDLQLVWEKRLITIPIITNIKDKIRAQIDAAMLTDKKPYWQAAQFYFEYDKNLTRALENVTKATEENPKAYYMFLYKAKIEKEMGKNAAAMETSKTSLALAKEAKNDDYVRMNEKLQKELKKTN